MAEEAEPVRITVQGQEFTVHTRPGEPGVYDYNWTNHPQGYGFTSAGAEDYQMSRAEMEQEIIDFLTEIDPATGFLD
jgi:hypothetical protein